MRAKCLLFILLSFSFVSGQVYHFKKYYTSDGLVQNSVWAINQDKLGRVWIGTEEGFSIYDGKEFINYDKYQGLNYSFINCFYAVNDSINLVGTGGDGVYVYYKPFLKQDTLIKIISSKDYLIDNSVTQILKDWNNNYWICTNSGVTKWSFDNSNNHQIIVTHFGTSKGLVAFETYGCVDSVDKVIWFGIKNTLYRFERTNIKQIKIPGFEEGYSCVPFLASNGGLYIAHTSTAFLLQNNFLTDLRRKYNVAYEGNGYRPFCEGKDGTIWFGSQKGVWYLNGESFNSIKEENGLEEEYVTSVYIDNQENHWIGTGYGLYKFSDYSFKQVVGGDRIGGVQSFLQLPNGEIYCWARQGTFIVNNNMIQPARSFSKFKEGIRKFEYLNGKFWIATVGNYYNYDETGLHKLSNGSTQKINWYMINKTDKGELLLVNGYNVLIKINESGTQQLLETNDKLPFDRPAAILEDSLGGVWVATYDKGLYYIKNKQMKTINKNDGIDEKEFRSLYLDSKNNVWIGSRNSGLYKYTNEIFEQFSLEDGLSSVNVQCVTEDKLGNIWIGTGRGINMYDGHKWYKFDESQGVKAGRVYSAFTDKNGILYFGSENGIYTFDPSIGFGDRSFSIRIKSMKLINGEDVFQSPAVKFDNTMLFKFGKSQTPSEKKTNVILPYYNNSVTFEYIASDLRYEDKLIYSYKLEGLDFNWSTPLAYNSVNFTNLAPGDYIFKVKAFNSYGDESNNVAEVYITINHPFWATWWAYSFYFLFGIGLIYSLRKYEVNRLRLKNLVKIDEALLIEREETDKMKSRFFANISHEFRTPLTLISGPLEKIVSNHSDEETAKQAGLIKRNTNRLLELINQLLDLSRLEAGKLQLKASPGNIVSFVKGITMSFESLAERKDISLKVKSEKGQIEVYFDRDMLAKILSNLLSNAFKFTPEGGEIIVSLTLVPSPNWRGMSDLSTGALVKAGGQGEDNVEITVTDSGIGISEEELPKLFDRFYQVDSSQTREYEGSGLGLALTKELVELHRGTIKAKSELGKGSEFIIELPLGREHLNDDELILGIEQDVILSPAKSGVKNLLDFDFKDSSRQNVGQASSDKNLTPQNDIEAKEDKTIILVVEDNADVREYIKDSLGDGFYVEEASNGEQGVRKAEQLIPDLIISDVMMPKMDGNELSRRIKNDEKTSHIPIILLTAKSEQESRIEGLETGADDYLTKPFDTKELLIRIKNLITIRRKLQEKYSGEKIILKKYSEKLSSIDEKFLCKVLEVVENHLSEEEFSIENFGEGVGMSRVQLHRKLKALTGKSASLYLRSVRLVKAKEMIKEKRGNISEIAYSVGFSSPAYFSACFKEEFGYPPSEIAH